MARMPGGGVICPRCDRWVPAYDLRLYDYRDGWLCAHCETPAGKAVPDSWLAA